MSSRELENLNILGIRRLISPDALKQKWPVSEKIAGHVLESRENIRRILHRRDSRLICIVGPCSIHDREEALEYARRLQTLREEVEDSLYIVMRVYFEKPRTVKGWRGMILDPHLDGSNDMETGISLARKILLDINALGLPAATEVLDPIIPQYILDLVSWAAIGARTTESQIHRELASGLSMPVGFKNSTDGSFVNSINGVEAASSGHTFLGVDGEGQTCLLKTSGNPDAHLILRGGHSGPNFNAESIWRTAEDLDKRGLPEAVIVDCSHANSLKDFRRQPGVCMDVVGQYVQGQDAIRGFMLESNLCEGRQAFSEQEGKSSLRYGVSITDSCIGWEQTAELIYEASAALRNGIELGRKLLMQI